MLAPVVRTALSEAGVPSRTEWVRALIRRNLACKHDGLPAVPKVARDWAISVCRRQCFHAYLGRREQDGLPRSVSKMRDTYQAVKWRGKGTAGGQLEAWMQA